MKAIRTAMLLGSAAGLVLATPAFAAGQAAETEAAPGEIIVTAQRRAESLNDVAMAVQAVDADTLQALRVTDVRDLTAVAPSFTVSQSYQGVPTYTLRGIGFNTINLSATSTVGTYVDEVAYAYPIMNTGPVMDLERVEVLKGPQGTLYGRNTTAGLINFITAKPTDKFEGGLSVDLGNYDTYNIGGHISGPLGEGIAARIAVRSENSDKGWQVSNSRGDRLGKVDKLGVRGSLALDPAEGTHIDMSVFWWQNKSDTVAGQGIGFTPATNPVTGTSNSRLFNAPGLANYLAANFPTKATQADWAPEAARSADIGTGLGLKGPLAENNRFWGLKLRIDQDLGPDMKLVSLTSYNDFKRDALSDWSGAPYEVLLQKTDGRIKSFAQELHVEGKSGPVNWLLGGYYANDRIVDANRTMLGQNANVGLIRYAGSGLLTSPFNSGGYTATQMAQAFRTYEDIGRIRTRTWSLFGNADWQLTDQFKASVGLRYTEDRQRYNGCSRDFNGNMLPNVNVVNRALYFQTYGVVAAPITQGQCNTFNPTTGTFGEVASVLEENNLAWRVALDWQPNNDTLVYASVSRGYKSGTTPINAANLARQNAPVVQEKLTAYELGLKATLADRKVQANVSVFYYDYADKQISTYFADPIYTALARLDNVPKSEAYGLEAELTVRPMRGVALTGNALWLHTRINSYNGTNAGGLPQNFDGSEFIYSPKFQGSVTLTYDTPISDGLNLNGAIAARYQSESNTIFEDLALYKIKPYAVVNASLGVKSESGWSASIWAKNLFDKYYWSAVASNANVVVRFPNPPRTFGVSLGYDF
ncbi:MAG TPA: TonB-dependent receptor [Novosphingobium sp.]|jgi:outer membrane receptor protein involved in Fe transport|nr:TonB-dependent receptor [Novosphingobium sp.]HQN53645.1 TonB-dependent receptor [Novosphingobium sp.]HQQ07655.1 TonB-dependent receptor [Novosphingobium sp.]